MFDKAKRLLKVREVSTNSLGVVGCCRPIYQPVWVMLCDTSGWDKSLIVIGITDHVRLGALASANVHVFLLVLKVAEVWVWGESCLVRLNL